MQGGSGWGLGCWALVVAFGACNGEIAPGLPRSSPAAGSTAPGVPGADPVEGVGAGTHPGDEPPPGPPERRTCRAFGPPPLLLEARPVFTGLPLAEPVALLRPPAGGHWYVVERSGQVRRFEDRP